MNALTSFRPSTSSSHVIVTGSLLLSISLLQQLLWIIRGSRGYNCEQFISTCNLQCRIFGIWYLPCHCNFLSPQMSEVQAQQQSSQQSTSSSSSSSMSSATTSTAADRSSVSSAAAPSASSTSSAASTGDTQSSEKQEQETVKVNEHLLSFRKKTFFQ